MKKLTRKQLLNVVVQCQVLFGEIRGAYDNDRGIDRASLIHAKTQVGEQLCIDALTAEDPQ